MPLISICIPAYKRVKYLERLLNSVLIQSFKNYEVIITDDSPNDEVYNLSRQFQQQLPIFYYKNTTALGTPANWNAAIQKASGKWIKLMHDDDWFAHAGALQQFADCALNTTNSFVFSAFINKFQNTGKESQCYAGWFRRWQFKRQPASLLSKNIIGHPSTTMHRNHKNYCYDEKLKWLVDVEMYVRSANAGPVSYIAKPLIMLGMSDGQVTAQVKNDPNVEVPEHLYFVEKAGLAIFKNLLAYDYFWRFIRNFNIQSKDDFINYKGEYNVPEIFVSMARFQKQIPRKVLNFGPFSKVLMIAHYITNQKYIR